MGTLVVSRVPLHGDKVKISQRVMGWPRDSVLLGEEEKAIDIARRLCGHHGKGNTITQVHEPKLWTRAVRRGSYPDGKIATWRVYTYRCVN